MYLINCYIVHAGRKWLWISIAIAAALLVMVFSILTYLRTRKIFSGMFFNPKVHLLDRISDA